MTRIAYCADLHGDQEKFKKFYAIKADYHIIGGDLLPKRGYMKELFTIQRKFMLEFIKPLLEKYKQSTKTLLMLGNDDLEPLEDIFIAWQEEDLCAHLHDNIFDIDQFQLIGFKYIPPSPFGLKNFERADARGISPEQYSPPVLCQQDGNFMKINFNSFLQDHPAIAQLLEKLPTPSEYPKTIYVMHSPPYQTGLDLTVKKEFVGSQDIRQFIEKNQPALFLCGHIHESPGTVRLGNTLCINPGQLYEFASLVFELDNGSIHIL